MAFDYQDAFNLAVAAAGVFGGWMLNRIYSALDRLDTDVRNIPIQYVLKEDFRSALTEIKTDMDVGFNKVSGTLERLFDKLEQKEDK